MSDRNDHFRLGVLHGFDDAPVYRWQDPVYQERYDTGYALGQLTRASQDFSTSSATERWAALEALLQRRGLGRDRS